MNSQCASCFFNISRHRSCLWSECAALSDIDWDEWNRDNLMERFNASENLTETVNKCIEELMKKFISEALSIVDEFCSCIANDERLDNKKFKRFSYSENCLLEHKMEKALIYSTSYRLKSQILQIIENHVAYR